MRTPTLAVIPAGAGPSTTREETPPKVCSRRTHLSMIFTDRSIPRPKIGRNLSRKPSTTSPAITVLSWGSAGRTVKSFSCTIYNLTKASPLLLYRGLADEPLAHETDREQRQRRGEDQDPGHVH